MRLHCVIMFTALLMEQTTQADTLGIDGVWANASGVESIREGNVGRACTQAQNAALVSAVKQAAGVLVESELSTKEREVIKQQQRIYELDIAQKVQTKTNGVIERFQEISRKIVSKTCEIRVKALVRKKSLKTILRSIVATLEKLKFPRTIVLVQELQTLQDG